MKDAGVAYATKKSREYFADSTIADNTEDICTFEIDELKLGKALGKGRFGTVYEVVDVTIHNEPSDAKWMQEERQFIHDHIKREQSNGDARYAIKVLSPEVIKDSGLFIQGIYDMSVETRILSDIEHTNIVKARAIAPVSPFEGEHFFIMMDRLYDTLSKRIQRWGKSAKRRNSLLGRTLMKDKGKKNATEIHLKKMMSAYDLSHALAYLHNRGIIYRDLKPENIGFDIRDDIKLFDFGLATEMKPSRKCDEYSDDYCSLYRLTGMTGSPRYMANEVAFEQPYNEKCDVYSFGILFWEMLSTKLSFKMYDIRTLQERVWNTGVAERPEMDSKWSKETQHLLSECWKSNHKDRPSMDYVAEHLRTEIVELRGGDCQGLEHEKRRSTFVFDKNTIQEQLLSQLDEEDLKD